MLVILGIAVLFYAVIPVIGAFLVRHNWRQFRNRFDNLRLSPLLNYRLYQTAGTGENLFRFLGGLESITDNQTLWVRNSDMTIPVDLKNAHIYLLPMTEGEFLNSGSSGDSSPERIKLNRVTSLTEGAKVYIGGTLGIQNDRPAFLSTRDNPLLILFYDCPDRNLSIRAIQAGRHKNEYWNGFTPYSLALGAFAELMYSFNFIARPAFRLSLISAIIAMFGPLFPLIPPGIIFTNIYSRLWRQARMYRAYRDLFRLPMKYIPPGKDAGILPNGEQYGFQVYSHLPSWVKEEDLSPIPDEIKNEKHSGWYLYGALTGKEEEPLGIPQDPLASFSAFPGDPGKLAHTYAVKAHGLEVFSCLLFIFGISLNILFITVIVYMVLLR